MVILMYSIMGQNNGTLKAPIFFISCAVLAVAFLVILVVQVLSGVA